MKVLQPLQGFPPFVLGDCGSTCKLVVAAAEAEAEAAKAVVAAVVAVVGAAV